MSGTKAGGLKAAATNKAKHGADFYKRIGSKGGKNGHTGGFAANPAIARLAGAKGGRKSKRGPSDKPYKKRTPKKAVKKAQKKDLKVIKHTMANFGSDYEIL